MKNPHGVEPTRFMRRKECDGGICCSDFIGIGFGSSKGSDLYIGNSYNNSFIDNDGTGGYECHPEYKKSLFVNTAGPNEDNYFTYGRDGNAGFF